MRSPFFTAFLQIRPQINQFYPSREQIIKVNKPYGKDKDERTLYGQLSLEMRDVRVILYSNRNNST